MAGSPKEHSQQEVVIITGSSGLIGSAAVKRFARRYRVVGFDKDGWPNPPPEAECVCFDLTSDESVNAGLERVKYAYGKRLASVIHLAAYYDFSGEPSRLYEEVTVRGTERLLRGLKDFQVEQFVFSSTMLVHAPAEPGRRIDEESPLEPKWDYPQSKVQTEKLIRNERDGIPAVVLRIAGVYDDRCHSVPLAHQIQRIYERRLTGRVYPGDTSRGQAFVHLDDLTEALWLAVEGRARLPDEVVLLIGEAETLRYEELQRTLGQLIHDEEWETQQIPKALAKTGAWFQDLVPGEEPFIKPWMIDLVDDHYALDIESARETLGWEPKHSLRETLPRMVSALKTDPGTFYRANKLDPPAWLQSGEAPAGAGRADTTEESDHKPASSAGGHSAHDAGSGDSPGKPHAGRHGGTAARAAHIAERERTGHHEMASRGGHHREAMVSERKHLEMVIGMRRGWLWTNFTNIALGLWLISSPFTFGYSHAGMIWSDVISGALLALFAAVSISPRMDFWGRWGVALVGVWLQFAPLLFWAPDAAAYVNDTFVGSLAIGLSILVPMMPGMAHHMAMMKPGPEIPPGWTYNPSTWHQRAPLIALGIAGWFISRYLAAVQLGYIDVAWEPFFGEGTLRVLRSEVSQAWPVSDAGLGAVAYTFEALMGFMGGVTRWRTMPWMVTFFGILVIPLGITHIILVILQPVVVGYWCTLCLAAAGIMLLMIPLTVDEVVAMVQFLIGARREGKPLWRTFWVGDTIRGGSEDARTPPYGSPFPNMAPATVWGVTVPWNLLASAGLGLWLLFAPAVFGTQGAAADSNHVVGALVLTVAAIATAEVIRAVRFLNLLLGVWIVGASWFLTGATGAARWNDALVGIALIVLSLPRGTVREHYGSWDRYVV